MTSNELGTILLVEDDEATADLERRVLARGGMKVRRVGRVRDAVELLRQGTFAAVVLDYQLPDGDPWTVLEVAQACNPRVPVVLVTAMGNELIAAEAIHRGVAEYIKKSDSFWDRLPSVVDRVARLAQAENRLRRADALFQLIAENASDMIWTASSDGRMTYVSPAATALLGYQPSELLDRTFESLLAPDERAATAPFSAHGLHRCLRKDGTAVWFETRVQIAAPPDGGGGEAIGVSRDVTARKEAERLLASERARLEEAQQLAHVGSWEWDVTADKVTWSTELYRIFGVEPTAFGASYPTYLALLHPDDRDHANAVIGSALVEKRPFDFEHRLVRPDGQIRTVRGRGRVTLDDAGEVARMAGTAQDITDQKVVAETLADQAAELARSNIELERFAYAASHDLRAPLRAIAQLAEWITEEEQTRLSTESQSHMALLKGRARRMETLLVDLLEYSRVGRVALDIETVDVAALLGEVFAGAAHRSTFSIEVARPMPVLETCPLPLRRVFMNLIDNAIKHHDRGAGVIRAAATAADHTVRFTIIDDGPGIPAPHHQRIFEMFQTLKPRDQIEGSGMGLSLVRKIVETAGGEIGVESEGRGTTFWFTWPVDWKPPGATRVAASPH